MSAELCELPATELLALMAQGATSSVEVVTAHLRRVERVNPGLNAIVKTNTPEFGAGSHTFNPVFGATHNPYDNARSAGGSRQWSRGRARGRDAAAR